MAPPPENWKDRMIDIGTWIVAGLAVVVVVWIVVFLVRWALGDVSVSGF